MTKALAVAYVVYLQGTPDDLTNLFITEKKNTLNIIKKLLFFYWAPKSFSISFKVFSLVSGTNQHSINNARQKK